MTTKANSTMSHADIVQMRDLLRHVQAWANGQGEGKPSPSYDYFRGMADAYKHAANLFDQQLGEDTQSDKEAAR